MTRIAIVGRPNVGKSTLFNRLVGKRRAIVDDSPGVTRDRIEADARLLDLGFTVVDTAGMAEGDDLLTSALRRQSEAALASADLGLFVIDARAGITALDQNLAEWLRRQDKPIILVANKCEADRDGSQANEGWSLGLGEPVAIAAEHRLGFTDLAEVIRPHILERAQRPKPAEDDEEGETLPLRIAVVGRPNAGKSSLINRFLGEERMLTGEQPGLTRDAVDVGWTWRGRDFQLVDTAGLRKKSRIEPGGLEKVSSSATVEAIKRVDMVVLAVDATRGMERQDQTIADLAVREGRALVVALNKWDLIDAPQERLNEHLRSLDRLLAQIKGLRLVPVSAATGYNVDRLLGEIVEVDRRWRSRVSTAELNRWLDVMVESHQPPLVQGRRIKLRYVTQVHTRPPTFALFGNQLPRLPESYLRYLTGGLRDHFDLGGVPIRWRKRTSQNPFDEGKTSGRR
ncbi:MAG: ribosome biogenesis GTPase Der [Geminicoccaceae bacterium]